MALRLLKIVVGCDYQDDLRALLDEHPIISRWDDQLSDEMFEANVLLKAEHTEAIMDELADSFEHGETFRVVLLGAEATLPRPEEDEDEEPDGDGDRMLRVSREELYQDVSDAATPTKIWITLVAVSAVVASGGLMRNDVAVVIGAMVIAPLLGPNVALALATRLADRKLAWRAIRASAIGITIVLVVSAIAGLIFQPSGEVETIAARSSVSLADVVLALAAGIAGTLAFTSGVSNALVGVMVAVALLPPMAVCGLMIGSGDGPAALAAGLLVSVNIISINLAGMATFFIQGVRPKDYYEADAAGKASRWVAIVLVTLIVTLSAIIGYEYDWLPFVNGSN